MRSPIPLHFKEFRLPQHRLQHWHPWSGNATAILLWTVLAQVREFSTGSFGWHFGDKLTVRVGDQLVKVQVGITMTVIGSKEAPRGAVEAA